MQYTTFSYTGNTIVKLCSNTPTMLLLCFTMSIPTLLRLDLRKKKFMFVFSTKKKKVKNILSRNSRDFLTQNQKELITTLQFDIKYFDLCVFEKNVSEKKKLLKTTRHSMHPKNISRITKLFQLIFVFLNNRVDSRVYSHHHKSTLNAARVQTMRKFYYARDVFPISFQKHITHSEFFSIVNYIL